MEKKITRCHQCNEELECIRIANVVPEGDEWITESVQGLCNDCYDGDYEDIDNKE